MKAQTYIHTYGKYVVRVGDGETYTYLLYIIFSMFAFSLVLRLPASSMNYIMICLVTRREYALGLDRACGGGSRPNHNLAMLYRHPSGIILEQNNCFQQMHTFWPKS